MKQEDIVHESKPAASKSQSDEKSTEMSKFVKLMALFCSIYDVNLRNVAKKHGLSV